MAEDPNERTVLDLPEHLTTELRRRSQAAAREIEANLTPLFASVYRTGWADGYLARHREAQEPADAQAVQRTAERLTAWLADRGTDLNPRAVAALLSTVAQTVNTDDLDGMCARDLANALHRTAHLLTTHPRRPLPEETRRRDR